jgi:hypothetical protein
MLMKFSEALQSMSTDTGVSERRGMETIMMNDDGESEEMVACKCTNPSDKETSVMQGLSELTPPEEPEFKPEPDLGQVPLGSGFIWFSSGQVQVLPLP